MFICFPAIAGEPSTVAPAPPMLVHPQTYVTQPESPARTYLTIPVAEESACGIGSFSGLWDSAICLVRTTLHMAMDAVQGTAGMAVNGTDQALTGTMGGIKAVANGSLGVTSVAENTTDRGLRTIQEFGQ